MNKIFLFGLIALATGCNHKMNSAKSNTTSMTAPEQPSNDGLIKLQKGQTYAVQSKISSSSSTEAQGQTMETKAEVTTLYNVNVADVVSSAGGNDVYKMNNKIASMKMSMAAMGQNTTFDSDNKDDMNGQIGTPLKGIINQPMNISMDKSGNIIADNTSKDSSKSDDPTAMMLKQLGDPAKMGYGAKMAFLHLPKDAKAGSSWQDADSSDGIKTVTNYVIKSVNGDTAVISVSGTDVREMKTQMQGMDIQTKTSGTFSGEELVNIHNGVIYKNTSTMDTKGTVSAMGQDFPTTVKVNSQTTVTQQ